VSEFPPALAYLLPHEGGFCDVDGDPGGPTNYGISLYWLKRCGDLDLADINHDGRVDIEDIRRLDGREAGALYQKHWWNHYRLEEIDNQRIASKLFDHAVNMGGVPAIRHLQSAMNACNALVGCDGVLGPITIAAVNRLNPQLLLEAYCADLAMFYQTLAAAKPKLRKFERGWLKRAREVPE